VRTEDEWHALCAAMGNPALAADPRFADRASRQRHAAELDALLETWTKPQDAQSLSERLRTRGVAAFKSLNSVDLVSSDHLWRRGFFQHVSDPVRGEMSITGAPWRLSVTPAKVTRSAPRLGEHNDYVFGELLGLSAAERERLVAEKIVY